MTYVQHPAFPDDKPLEVTDPGPWLEQGWVELAEKDAAEVDPTITPQPGRNASWEEWAAYAKTAHNAPDADLEGKSRNDLINQYGF